MTALRPSTMLVRNPNGCFVPNSGKRYWVACLRDALGTPAVRCPHEHEIASKP